MTAATELAQIKERLNAATPGPWAAYAGCIRQDRSWRDASHVVVDYDGERPSIPNAVFIAAAPVDVARLTRAVEGVLGLHQPITVYEYDDTNGTFTQDGEGEQIEMKTLCAACTGDSVLELIGDCEYDDTDYHDETAWPCPTVAAIENALNPKEGQ